MKYVVTINEREYQVEILDEKLKAVDTGLGAPATPAKPVEKKN